MDEQVGELSKAYEIVVKDVYVLIRATPGQLVTADLIISMLEEAYSLEAYRSDKKAGLWDFRGCRAEFDFDGMMKVREYVEAHFDASWTLQFTALVVDAEALFGLARMYEALTEKVPTEVGIFRDLEEAREWLITRAA